MTNQRSTSDCLDNCNQKGEEKRDEEKWIESDGENHIEGVGRRERDNEIERASEVKRDHGSKIEKELCAMIPGFVYAVVCTQITSAFLFPLSSLSLPSILSVPSLYPLCPFHLSSLSPLLTSPWTLFLAHVQYGDHGRDRG